MRSRGRSSVDTGFVAELESSPRVTDGVHRRTVSTLARPAPDAPVSPSALPPSVTLSPRTVWIAGGVLAVVFVAVFTDFFLKQVRFAINMPSDWGHTLVVPGVVAYFIWLRREELKSTEFRPCWWGLAIIGLGMGWYSLCVFGPRPLFHHNLLGVGVFVTLFGVVLLLLGTAAMRWLWFPIAYLAIFSQAISEVVLNRVTFQLQDLAAAGAYLLLATFGMEVDRSGNTLTVWSDGVPHPLNVAEACSGMRMLVAFLALGTYFAYVNLQLTWQRIALVLCAVPVALAVNVLRVTSLGILSLFDTNLAQGEFHHFVGVLWLLPGLAMFLGVVWILRRMVVDDTGDHSP
ncbi:MAG: exosortase/archaeosortase family protein [Phycisphaerales bacterium]|nr:exosortase/archaeosortase family protein [Phycisphaerales bacterium]